jgi:hypothetical protein
MEVLKRNLIFHSKTTKQDPDAGETYFIIHPVLKHIAILDCI